VKRDAQAVLLLLIGGTLIKISLNGTYVRYVKVGLRPLLLVAGVVLIVIAAASLWRAIRPPVPAAAELGADGGHGTYGALGTDEGHGTDEGLGTDEGHGTDDLDEHEHEHEHEHGRIGWLLLAPTLALLLFAPPAVGAFQASRNGTALSAAGASDYAALPEGDPVRLTVLDYASRAVFDRGRSLQDRRVVLTGFVIEGPNGRPYLARMIVSCCAADARPIKVALTGAVPLDLAPDTWIEVVGAYLARADRDPVNGDVIPFLEVGSVKEIPAPVQQYES
jgi:uncharacterized repeat protein (TIGR03943 family)